MSLENAYYNREDTQPAYLNQQIERQSFYERQPSSKRQVKSFKLTRNEKETDLQLIQEEKEIRGTPKQKEEALFEFKINVIEAEQEKDTKSELHRAVKEYPSEEKARVMPLGEIMQRMKQKSSGNVAQQINQEKSFYQVNSTIDEHFKYKEIGQIMDILKERYGLFSRTKTGFERRPLY
mmetsp:Transcript_11455/g.11458  ORF Transcript_11455/g.11458 Transcript_11455/m.11458 type:complete len:179 (+) Transcript_11455:375-911(+)